MICEKCGIAAEIKPLSNHRCKDCDNYLKERPKENKKYMANRNLSFKVLQLLNEFGDDAVIEVLSEPDSLNRVQFMEYWRDNYLTPYGVRAQCFHGELDRLLDSDKTYRIFNQHFKKEIGS
jgi:hypothetical protein